MNNPGFNYFDRGLPQDLNGLHGWRERALELWRLIWRRTASMPSHAPENGNGVSLADWLFDHYFKSRWKLPGFLLQAVLDTYIVLENRIGIIRGRRMEFEPPEGDAITEQSSDLMTVHYDMPLELFENFLGKSMKYSMGLWERGAANLEEAQDAMLTDLCRKAEIEDGDAILDIGCGFGSFAAHALRAFPKSTVHGLTLSKVQADYIRQKQAEPGHPLNTERFKLIEGNFNTVQFEPVYDRVISIGVFEHVANLSMALEKMSKVLKPEGTCFLHYIVFFQPLERMASGSLRGGPIIKHIFPGGRIWFEKELYKHQDHLRIEKSWSMNGINYRHTLESWLGNYWRNMKRIRAASGLDNQILKLWDLYLRACIGVFKANRGKFYGNGQYLLKHAAPSRRSGSQGTFPEEAKGLEAVYSCPLHWHTAWPEPGSCPLCGLDLDLVDPADSRCLTDLNTVATGRPQPSVPQRGLPGGLRHGSARRGGA